MSAAPAKKSTKPAPAEHPPYIEMIKASILTLKERSGSSRQAIAKHINANYKGITDETLKTHLKLALMRGVASGKLLQPKGKGGSGSFKVAPEAKVEKKKPKKKAAPKKPAAKPKKATTPKKKPAAKKPTPRKLRNRLLRSLPSPPRKRPPKKRRRNQ